MRLLLDTHIAVWAIGGSDRLTDEARRLVSSPDNDVFVSVVSIWEIAIKRALARASAPKVSAARAMQMFEEAGYAVLSVSAAHAAATENLPLRHRDPFDRLLVAQAQVEPMRLVTSDAVLQAYGPHVVTV